MTGTTARRRAKRLTTKFISSPVFPVLGWTKVVETVVAGGPTLNWAAYAGLVTLVWVFGDELDQRADAAVDAADDALDGVADDERGGPE